MPVLFAGFLRVQVYVCTISRICEGTGMCLYYYAGFLRVQVCACTICRIFEGAGICLYDEQDL